MTQENIVFQQPARRDVPLFNSAFWNAASAECKRRQIPPRAGFKKRNRRDITALAAEGYILSEPC
jgi:hypothetical protein